MIDYPALPDRECPDCCGPSRKVGERCDHCQSLFYIQDEARKAERARIVRLVEGLRNNDDMPMDDWNNALAALLEKIKEESTDA